MKSTGAQRRLLQLEVPADRLVIGARLAKYVEAMIAAIEPRWEILSAGMDGRRRPHLQRN
jgi:hypothetical protein